jgi:hypothetical protein
MKRTGLFFPLILFATFFHIYSASSAATRGISVVSKQGKALKLYDSYNALAVGCSRPGAT